MPQMLIIFAEMTNNLILLFDILCLERILQLSYLSNDQHQIGRMTPVNSQL